ncbi:MAG TPA: low affinity iron permease family protein [Solimonas sp.]
MSRKSEKSAFTRFAQATATFAGRPVTFATATMIVLLWAVLGPVFGYSDTWQLVINTGTTIVTFLMVFLIQNTQNRDSEAMHIKLDEIICALDGANKALLNLEDLDEGELDEIRERYLSAAKQAHKSPRKPRAPRRRGS